MLIVGGQNLGAKRQSCARDIECRLHESRSLTFCSLAMSIVASVQSVKYWRGQSGNLRMTVGASTEGTRALQRTFPNTICSWTWNTARRWGKQRSR